MYVYIYVYIYIRIHKQTYRIYIYIYRAPPMPPTREKKTIARYAVVGEFFYGLGGPWRSESGGFWKVWRSAGVPKSV